MSMLLKGDNGNEFELALIEDRFPEIQDDSSDSTYVTLSFRVANGDETWEETAPCMNLYELTNLEEWLNAVARAQPDVSEIELLEPELRFSVTSRSNDQVTLRIGFHLDNRPEEFRVDADTTEADHVDIRLERPQIAAAAAELHRDLEAASQAGPLSPDAAEQDSGIIGLPDEALNLLEDDAPPLDESDKDRHF